MNSLPSQQEAARELLIRRRARANILEYVNAIDVPGRPIEEDEDTDGFEPLALAETTIAAHHRLLLEKAEETSQTPHGRLMVFMPPGSAKSTYASVVFPSRYLGAKAGRKVILASYGDDLARKMGRRTRSIIKQDRFRGIYGAGLTSESQAAQEFSLTNASEYMACGILGGVTGNRANGIIIDDPIKGREQANSETIRQKTYDAYEDDLKTRLIPGGWIILIQCMVGDTLVMLSDGTERPLRDIRPGDQVATFKDGKLITSVVKNWSSNGPDFIYAIKTTSGRIVRANARHPFLVSDDGKSKWIRTKNLRPGHKMFRVNGENGRAKPARMTDAVFPPKVGDIACRTTTKSGGLTVFVRRLPTKILDALHISSIVTASLWPNIPKCLRSKMASVRSANSRPEITCALIGAENCASIIATTAKKSGHSFAMTAILPLGMRRLLESLQRSPNISDFTLDEIVEITPDGFEEVFDVQIEDTENFIANGLVSHNTRWHESDLAGRILPEGWKGESGKILCRDGNVWDVVCLQARCEVEGDPLGRARGEYLWPEWFDRKHWSQFEQNARTWAALYQQLPTPLDGDLFKPDQIKIIDAIPAGPITWVRGWDLASTTDGDWTAGVRLGKLPDGHFIVADVKRIRVGPDERDAAIKNTADSDGRTVKISIPQDPGQAGKTQVLYLTRSLAGHRVTSSPESGDKVTRAEPFAAQVNVGNVMMLRGDWNKPFTDELRMFPNGTYDDQVDAASRAFGELIGKNMMKINDELLRRA